MFSNLRTVSYTHLDVYKRQDEMHTIIGAGSAEGSIDASSMLKPVLARGAFQIIGATTAEEFRKYLAKDPAFERRFQAIDCLLYTSRCV